MNRRDYLIQMGAAGTLIGASDILSPSVYAAPTMQGQQPIRASAKKPTFLFAPKTPTFPASTNLIVFFAGLMAFSNTKNGVAEVGFHRGTGKHKLEINLYLNIAGVCHKLPSISGNDLAGVKTIELDFSPQQPAGVDFFHKDDFNRNPTDDKRDFGWVLDFEDSYLYPDGVDFIHKFSPVLKLNQGTLYTHQLTNSKFNLIDVQGNAVQQPLNQVPRLIGAAINIPAGTDAVLKLDGDVAVQLPQIPNVVYQMQFINDCYEDEHEHCKWTKPKDANEIVRNDFYMHYLMFTPKNPNTKKYGVILDNQVTLGNLDMCPPKIAAATDEAPCMGTGFGRTPGF